MGFLLFGSEVDRVARLLFLISEHECYMMEDMCFFFLPVMPGNNIRSSSSSSTSSSSSVLSFSKRLKPRTRSRTRDVPYIQPTPTLSHKTV